MTNSVSALSTEDQAAADADTLPQSAQQNSLFLLWIFPVIVPPLTILLSFYLQEWYWGLMDDAGLISAGSAVTKRFSSIFLGFLAFGEFKPTFALHQAIFYALFRYSPVSMHVLKWIEACLVLAVWGAAVQSISGKRVSMLIFISAALSFHYLYDTFFFLSTHEFLGVLFCGLALNCFLSGLQARSQFQFATLFTAGVLSMVVGFGAKEPLVAVGVAFGLGFLILGRIEKEQRSRALWVGLVNLVGTVIYGIGLKVFAQGAYTSSYSFTNWPRMFGNISAWLFKDFANHLPWVILVVLLGTAASRSGPRLGLLSIFTTRQKWGIFTGVLLYGGYLAILLPWSTTSYYAGPLGVFFAFPVAIFVAEILPKTSMVVQVLIPIGALLFNMLVSQWALTRESYYHYDTQNLMAWVLGNAAFQAAAREKMVYCNGMEAAGTIPGHLARDFSLQLPPFKHSGTQIDPTISKAIIVRSPRFGGAETDFPSASWDTMFYSKFWQVYVRK